MKTLGELRETCSHRGRTPRLAEEGRKEGRKEDTHPRCGAVAPRGHRLSSLLSRGKDAEPVLKDTECPVFLKILKGGTESVRTSLGPDGSPGRKGPGEHALVPASSSRAVGPGPGVGVGAQGGWQRHPAWRGRIQPEQSSPEQRRCGLAGRGGRSPEEGRDAAAESRPRPDQERLGLPGWE